MIWKSCGTLRTTSKVNLHGERFDFFPQGVKLTVHPSETGWRFMTEILNCQYQEIIEISDLDHLRKTRIVMIGYPRFCLRNIHTSDSKVA